MWLGQGSYDRLSWIIEIEPKCGLKSLYKIEAEGDFT